MTDACPACGSAAPPRPVEDYADPVAGRRYALKECAACAVVFSEPREAVGPDWYEAAGPLRGREPSGDPRKDWRFARFLEAGLPPGKVLDVGCGEGGFLLLARERGWEVSGFDYDRRVVDLARAKGLSDVRAEEFSAFMRSRADGEFDAAVLFDVLEHVPEPRAFLREVRRVLKAGGVLAVTLPDARRPLPFGRELHDYPPMHFTRWTGEALAGFLEREGFRMVRVESSGLPLAYFADHLFFYVVMGGLLRAARLLLFGRRGADRTVSELYREEAASPPGPRGRLRERLRDPRARRRLTLALRAALAPVLYPAAAVLRLLYPGRSRGAHLFVLARLDKAV